MVSVCVCVCVCAFVWCAWWGEGGSKTSKNEKNIYKNQTLNPQQKKQIAKLQPKKRKNEEKKIRFVHPEYINTINCPKAKFSIQSKKLTTFNPV